MPEKGRVSPACGHMAGKKQWPVPRGEKPPLWRQASSNPGNLDYVKSKSGWGGALTSSSPSNAKVPIPNHKRAFEMTLFKHSDSKCSQKAFPLLSIWNGVGGRGWHYFVFWSLRSHFFMKAFNGVGRLRVKELFQREPNTITTLRMPQLFLKQRESLGKEPTKETSLGKEQKSRLTNIMDIFKPAQQEVSAIHPLFSSVSSPGRNVQEVNVRGNWG